MQEIAYRRFLLRVFATQPGRWVVKGGAALLLRLDPNRTSNDIDRAYVDEAGEHAVALKALREAVRYPVADFFRFEIASGQVVDPEHPLERTFSVPVIAFLGEREFARFNIDLALPRDDIDAELVAVQTSLTGEGAVDEIPSITTLTFPAQIADKTCRFTSGTAIPGSTPRVPETADLLRRGPGTGVSVDRSGTGWDGGRDYVGRPRSGVEDSNRLAIVTLGWRAGAAHDRHHPPASH